MRDVVIRDGAANFRGEPEPGRNGIRKSITQDGRGIVVLGRAVSVRTSELKAVAHPLLDVYLKGFVGGVGSKRHAPDKSEVRVDPVTALFFSMPRRPPGCTLFPYPTHAFPACSRNSSSR